ncbi:MAG: threonine synthase [Desulfobacteraceae bacterium]|nr:threonine synthase [Desulfobacteraceae bacterium]
MKPHQFPPEMQQLLVPEPRGHLNYRCLGCGSEYGIARLLYTCPECGQVLLIYDADFSRLKEVPGEQWRRIFDSRRMLNIPALKGIYRYHELIGPILSQEDILYLGEGHTPLVEANPLLQERVGLRFFFKNDGQNPSASFKDRGMASALSYIRHLIRSGAVSEVLAVCASTGDTSAAAALYAAYLQPKVKSAVLLPHGKVTPQQLAQPLGAGAVVFEIPGVFDDCMKVVESLAERYHVALLNSKNAWRILGQESYAYEIAQDFDYDMKNRAVVVPVGNAGNITAVMSGFLKLLELGIIEDLPKIVGVQSVHANPVVRYYTETDPQKRRFVPVTVRASVAQAAMIGNPVSMPRVVHLVEQYHRAAGAEKVCFVEVSEQEIMDWQLLANRNGHIACTHGGESLAAVAAAMQRGFLDATDIAVIDSTAHVLKFLGFQEMYFENRFPAEYEVTPHRHLVNAPLQIRPQGLKRFPAPGHPLEGEDFQAFVQAVSEDIAGRLQLKKVALS